METETQKEEKQMPLKRDLFLTPFGIFMGSVIGYISAFLDPLFLSDTIKEVRRGLKPNFSSLGIYSSALISYNFCLYKIVENLVEHPDKPISYIPVATNLVSGICQVIYKAGKKKGLENKILNDAHD